MNFGIIVDWYGPFDDLKTLRNVGREYVKNDKVLYMALTKGNVISYIGLSTDAPNRFGNHKTLTDNAASFTKFFIGNIESHGVSGAKVGKHPRDLKLAEHMLINVVYPDLNISLKDSMPKMCGSLYNRFYSENDVGEYVSTEKNPLPKFPTFIGYNSHAEWYEYSKSVDYA